MLKGPQAKILCLIDEEGDISPKDMYEVRARLPETAIVRFIPSITWGGISQVKSWIEAMSYAHERLGSWEWIINLSAECLPLKSSVELNDFLAEGFRRNIVSYMLFYSDLGYKVDKKNVSTNELVDGCEEMLRCDPRRISDYEVSRARIRADAGQATEGIVQRMIMEWPFRGALRCNEIGNKRISLRRLTKIELDDRARFLSTFGLSGGRAWFGFHRVMVSAILNSSITQQLYNGLQHFLCPDEMFFQTLYNNISDKLPGHCEPFNFHFAQGEPLQVSDENSSEILSSDAWFVRKVSYHECPAILNAVRDRVKS
ncbi:beta-1,6-N-acetylglucosaminyltransferase [uncultured Methylobacterium sp.]|uniref:beta-1,6-N-acetylglucosaminyltransferase n=1 Tax=uncultured Methylobacterium sp. TaxID=157278 RepID=UPI0035CABA3F